MNAIQYFDWGGSPFGKDLRLDVIQTKEENKERYFLAGWGFKDTLGNSYFIDSHTSTHYIEHGWSYYGVMGPRVCPKFTPSLFPTLNKTTIVSAYYLIISFPISDDFEAILQHITARVNNNSHNSRIVSITRLGTFSDFRGVYYNVRVVIDGENLPFINYNKVTVTI